MLLSDEFSVVYFFRRNYFSSARAVKHLYLLPSHCVLRCGGESDTQSGSVCVLFCFVYFCSTAPSTSKPSTRLWLLTTRVTYFLFLLCAFVSVRTGQVLGGYILYSNEGLPQGPRGCDRSVCADAPLQYTMRWQRRRCSGSSLQGRGTTAGPR
ncbi:hypothetical protein LSM04_009234 [Trypanosoma melophagium]|uniref:uncharacterized protein n=1 Tax=Trypanosoma melophagium TaxID=715481 RepID=UPI003519F2C9|nr:hypothetical protein LSM04_009234 [Trypanosoma melophagium]